MTSRPGGGRIWQPDRYLWPSRCTPVQQGRDDGLYVRPNGYLYNVIDGKRNYDVTPAIGEKTLYEEMRQFYR